jgi:hypothetical protein
MSSAQHTIVKVLAFPTYPPPTTTTLEYFPPRNVRVTHNGLLCVTSEGWKECLLEMPALDYKRKNPDFLPG